MCATVGCFFLFYFISADQLPSERNFMYHSLTFHLFLSQPHTQIHSDIVARMCSNVVTHTRFSSFLHFISVPACFEITATLAARDQSISVWRMAEPSVESTSKLVFIFAAIEKRNKHIWHGMAGHGCIVNLFIRIHPFDMLINVQCLLVARTRHVLYWVCVYASIDRSFIRLSDECTYEYVRFKLNYETALFLFLSVCVCVIYNESDRGFQQFCMQVCACACVCGYKIDLYVPMCVQHTCYVLSGFACNFSFA